MRLRSNVSQKHPVNLCLPVTGTILDRSDRIFLFLKHVILGDNANLEAKGADAVKSTSGSNSSRGGGGGGVIVISYKEGFVGNRPTPSKNTKGGDGTSSGDNGIVVLNGTLL